MKSLRIKIAILAVCLLILLLGCGIFFFLKRPDKIVGSYLSKNFLSADLVQKTTAELGVHLAQKKDYQSAKKIFEELLAVDPTNVYWLNNLGYLEEELGNHEKSTHYFEAALRTSPECAECLNNYGALLARTGNIDNALTQLQKSVSLKEDYVDALLNLAVIQEQQSRWQASLDWYRRAEVKIVDSDLKKWVQFRVSLLKEIVESNTRQISQSP